MFFFCLLVSYQVQASDCLSSFEAKAIIKERLATASSTKEGLIQLSEGDTTKVFSPETLFTVDLKIDAEVEKRVKELEQTVQNFELDAVLEKIKDCAKADVELSKLLTELVSVEKEVNTLRLAFLTLPKDQQEALLSLHKQISEQEESLKKLVFEKESAEKRSSDADVSLRKAENQAQTAESNELREIATAKAILEKYRIEIADLTIK